MMNVIVDTSVWSLALRRLSVSSNAVVKELHSLVTEGRVAMLGVIRQELLSGIRADSQFEKLRDHLRVFPDVSIASSDHEEAALFSNRCRAAGIQGSHTDFLICAVATHHGFAILTMDNDFHHFAKILPVVLHRSSTNTDLIHPSR
jgi:predicted nucleic acid-binding protein